MTPQEFEAHFHHRPFNAFMVHLDDGMHYDVLSPDSVAHVTGSRHFIVIDVRDCARNFEDAMITASRQRQGSSCLLKQASR